MLTRVSSRLIRGTGGFVALTAGSYAACTSADKEWKPLLDATGRAVRLVGTVACIVADYKAAEWQWNTNMFQLDQDRDHQQRTYWEEEVKRLQHVLEDAQVTYSTNNLPHLTYTERLEAKRHEKEAMMKAAYELAQAEEHLTKYGSSRKSVVHQRAADRLLKLCQENRGVYIKVGQHLANLDYLIPQEYIDTLSKLFDDNPRTSTDDVAAVIREELGADPHQIFASFEPSPIASASLAQVHVAYEKGSGRKLAVKVQHRGLRESAVGDIKAVVAVVRLVEYIFKDFKWGWICDEIEPLLPRELDFQNEGRNAERANSNLSATGLDCIIPKVLWKYTTPRVLVMEFEEGFKATDVSAIEKAGLSKSEVSRLISSVFASQVFISGFVHCDPHPANVLLRAKPNGKPEMVLVDHGLYRELESEFLLHYSRLWKALMLADIPSIKESCKELGVAHAYPLFAALVTSRPFDEIIERSKTGNLSKPKEPRTSKVDKVVMTGYARRFLGDIFELLAKVPRPMLLLLKTNDCLRHIDNSLGSPANTLLVNGSYAATAVYRNDSKNGSWWSGFRVWLDYIKVLLRIQVHSIALQWSPLLNQSVEYLLEAVQIVNTSN